MPPRVPDLGEAELETLKTLWDGGPATVREVRQRLAQRGRKVAHTTVLTFLTRLEQKGCVRADKTGHAYRYRARVSRDRIVGSRVRETVKQLFDGAAAPLVLHLMEHESFSPDELAALQRHIDDLARQQEGRRPRR
ncbi:MAG: BlaI/MecI/CopY family transcriptional regulator [Planctomycetota bacterium]|nr:MAG: BlaI/MecI/CopY family transcriptional regulator [Planctomycetota bacterium]